MRDYMEIGSSPTEEDCIMVSKDVDYIPEMRRQARIFRDQLVRQFGNPPVGASLLVKTFHHDFGPYMEVVCYFDDTIEASEEYALKIEGNTPEKWDEESLKELRKPKSCSI